MPDPKDKIITEVVPVVPLAESAAQVKRPYLIVLAGTGAGRLIPLEETVTIGRVGGADVGLEDQAISREHCRIVLDAFGEASVEDLGSTNGTFANGARLSRQTPLVDGDQIRLGATTILKFSLQDELEARFQQNLFNAALRDHLTQLYNKRYMTDRCEQEFAYSQRHGSSFALLLLDLDHFKQVNDRHGHPAGDHVLQLVAQQLKAVVRHEDVVGRFGGEEFAVLAHGVNAGRALLLAERIRHLVSQSPYRWAGQPLTVTTSIGVAGLPDPTIYSPEELISRADEALYRAKRDGRNLSRIYAEGHPE